MDYLKWPFFEEQHGILARDLHLWAKENLQNLSHDPAQTHDVCRDLVKKLGRGGWLKYAVPKAYGGQNEKLDVRSLCLIREILASYDGLADFAFAMQGLGSGTLSLFGSEKQKKDYLPAVGRGDKIAAFALSEPQAGSDVAALSSHFYEEGDEFILTGCKTWISNGGIADYYIVFVREKDTQGSQGISAFVVDADTEGLEIAENIAVSAPHPLAKITFKDVRLAKSTLIGERGRGFKYAMATLDIFRTTVGAAAMGFAKRALNEALNHATTREIYGGLQSDLQMIQSKIGDMELDIEASALLIYRAGWTKDQGAERLTKEAAMAKLYATEAAYKIIDDAVQIFGAQGVVSGEIVERLTREVRALRIYEGASEVQKMIIAGEVIKNFKL